MTNKILDFYKKESGTRDFAVLIAVLLVMLIGFAIWFATMPEPHSTYAMACKVMALDKESDTVILVDYASGNEWAWEGITDEMVGDTVIAVMDDAGTPQNFIDDVILSLK